MTSDEQMKAWVEGNPQCPNDDGECCPDFSCCQPELLADQQTREAFAKADDEGRMQFLGMFLGAAMGAMTDKKVYIAGVDDPEHDCH